MPELLRKIEADYISAYKARREVEVAVLRMLKTALKNMQVDLGREPEDHEVLDAIMRQVKQRKESIEQFRAAGRTELADREQAELEALAAYLPTPLTPEQTSALVDAVIAELGAAGMQDMGRVMGAINASHKGRVDGKALAALVRARLGAGPKA
ncbi:GatB/YqeY domain-containing protein [Desulfocurvus sp.]|jgi:hypothetical protein|uniref:GatB/YqeY domain-containing protein n=1 Tax=Desulfocurvus sp. TaxID=2871698 RepID=UPI0025C1ADB1|nr:GatB/YqeY domain-containing protein [Desulfocurvus sp.]MCK9239258.1 GatB/YqeY domain-containing protein [Desulfocurvus sp.]